MYEDMQPLYANPVLPLLAIAFADGAFQDYLTFKEIEAIPPPVDGSLHQLRIRQEWHRVPFFRTMSPEGPTTKIQPAVPFSSAWSAWAIGPGMKKISGFTTLGGRPWSRPMVGPTERGRGEGTC